MRAAVFGLICFVCFPVSAQVRPEQAIDYRQSLFGVIAWNFGQMSAMVRGTVPYDKEKFRRNAERVAVLSSGIVEGFPVGSDKGAATEAKAEIWKKFPDFQAKAKAFETEASSLAALSKGGDFTKIKAQFGKTGGTCKSCHDVYKAE